MMASTTRAFWNCKMAWQPSPSSELVPSSQHRTSPFTFRYSRPPSSLRPWLWASLFFCPRSRATRIGCKPPHRRNRGSSQEVKLSKLSWNYLISWKFVCWVPTGINRVVSWGPEASSSQQPLGLRVLKYIFSLQRLSFFWRGSESHGKNRVPDNLPFYEHSGRRPRRTLCGNLHFYASYESCFWPRI